MNPYRYTSKPEFNLSNPEDFRKLERMAYDMTIEIDNFPPTAYCYFDKLRNLYARYKYDNLPKESAEAEKKKLYYEYMESTAAYHRWCGVHKAYQENIRKAGSLRNDIEKSEDIKEIALKACEVIALMTGDDSFAERQKRKIQEQVKKKIHERKLKQ